MHLSGQFGDVLLSINADGKPIARYSRPVSRQKVKQVGSRCLSSEFGVWSSEFGVQSLEFRVQSSEFRVWGSEFGVQSLEFRVQGSEFRVQGLDGFRKPFANPITCVWLGLANGFGAR